MDIQNQIRKYRNELNLSQEQLAEKIYVSRQSISNWETGKSFPDINSLIAMSILFNISLDQLIKGDVEMMKDVVSKKRYSASLKTMVTLIVIALVAYIVTFFTTNMSTKIILNVVSLLNVGIMLYIATQLEMIKRKNGYTYFELLAYIENKEEASFNSEKLKQELKTKNIIFNICFILTGLILAAVIFDLIQIFAR